MKHLFSRITPSKSPAFSDNSTAHFSPIKVAIIDIDKPISALDNSRIDGSTYNSFWVLALRGGEPIACVEGAFGGATVNEQRLRDLVDEAVESSVQCASHKRTNVDDDELPFISIVIPTTFDRLEQLKHCVTRLLTLDYPLFEVVVVDNRPDRPAGAAERAVLEELPLVSVVEEPTRGISAARNAGVRAASGSVIAFTDDDVGPHVNWLRAIGRRFASEPATACVTGLVVPGELETPSQCWFESSGLSLDRNFFPYWYELSSRASLGRFRLSREDYLVEQRVGAACIARHWIYMTGSFGMGCNFAFRRQTLLELGDFDEALGAGTPAQAGEDIDALIRLLFAGGRLAYEPAAIVSHTHRRTYPELQRQTYGYGTGLTAAFSGLAWKNPWHIVGFLRVLAPGVRSLITPTASMKTSRRPEDYPTELSRLELRGMLAGPAAYVRSRRVIAGQRTLTVRARHHRTNMPARSGERSRASALARASQLASPR